MGHDWENDKTHVLARASFALPTCVLEGLAGHRVFSVSPIRLGKDPSNDYVLSDTSVSRFHATIQQTPSGYLIRDLGSTNGVWVNGVRIREAWLEPGAQLRLGEEAVTFRAVVQEHQSVPSGKRRLGDMVGDSEAIRRVFDLVEKVASTDVTLLVLGETGTGKEVMARTVHQLSRRSRGPFAVVDCSTIPEALIESELFGHEKGAFTGALSVRCGLFEEADGGTLFLDEIGELPLSVQPKLLRVLEQGEFRRVGGSRLLRTDVRVIAATNRNLFEEVDAGRFRKDLLYRLHVVPVRLPALRERMQDLELLVDELLARVRQRPWGEGVTSVAPQFFDELRRWHFPGNVRELAHLLEREVALADGPVLTRLQVPFTDGSRPGQGFSTPNDAEHSSTAHSSAAAPAATVVASSVVPSSVPASEVTVGSEGLAAYRDAKDETLQEFHRGYLMRAMRLSKGSISGAARLSGMERKQIRALLRELGLEALADKGQE